MEYSQICFTHVYFLLLSQWPNLRDEERTYLYDNQRCRSGTSLLVCFATGRPIYYVPFSSNSHPHQDIFLAKYKLQTCLHVQNLGEAGALVEQTIQPGEAQKDRFFQLEKKKKSNHLKRTLLFDKGPRRTDLGPTKYPPQHQLFQHTHFSVKRGLLRCWDFDVCLWYLHVFHWQIFLSVTGHGTRMDEIWRCFFLVWWVGWLGDVWKGWCARELLDFGLVEA